MKKQEIIEGNKLIASFMGGHLSNHPELNGVQVWSGYELIEGRLNLPSTLKYHSSWDWLMQVVEKIEKLKFSSKAQSGSFPMKFTFLRDSKGESNIISLTCASIDVPWIRKDNENKIEAVWLAVVEFIKWCNNFWGWIQYRYLIENE